MNRWCILDLALKYLQRVGIYHSLIIGYHPPPHMNSVLVICRNSDKNLAAKLLLFSRIDIPAETDCNHTVHDKVG